MSKIWMLEEDQSQYYHDAHNRRTSRGGPRRQSHHHKTHTMRRLRRMCRREAEAAWYRVRRKTKKILDTRGKWKLQHKLESFS